MGSSNTWRHLALGVPCACPPRHQLHTPCLALSGRHRQHTDRLKALKPSAEYALSVVIGPTHLIHGPLVRSLHHPSLMHCLIGLSPLFTIVVICTITACLHQPSHHGHIRHGAGDGAQLMYVPHASDDMSDKRGMLQKHSEHPIMFEAAVWTTRVQQGGGQ